MQSLVARGEREDALSSRAGFCPGFSQDRAQDLAVALRRDRQPMFEIPRGKAAFVGVVAKFDLALFQRLPIGRADDGQQHAATRPVRQ